jgi:hypothetical protein
VNVSDQIVEIDPTVRKALNFIETGTNLMFYTLIKQECEFVFVTNLVIQVHKLLFTKCSQPIKDAIIRTFPYVCIYPFCIQ